VRAYDIIKKKRDGFALTYEELSSFLTAYLKNEIPDYQVSAFLMAILCKGMNPEETKYLTKIMLNSGAVLDLSDMDGPKVDKHSTGGVGDKVSLILAPLVASAGIIVPMMSGRGLGHTGGTLDKLESIPGFKTLLNMEGFKNILSEIGCAIIGFSEEMALLDRKLYALRDVTATVESIPLITGSIMSKKLSEGINGLVLDVKVGSGAFMKDLEGARELAKSMVDIGNSFGVRTVAVITNMDEPLGLAIGNSLEVLETIEALKGRGPEDLMEVTYFLGALMLKIANIETDLENGQKKLKQLIINGSALAKFREMIQHQGGNVNIIDTPSLLPSSRFRQDVISEYKGYIQSMDAEAIGTASMILGAGRETMDSVIDHSAGILLKKKVGDYVTKGDKLCTLYTNNDSVIEKAEEIFLNALTIGDEPPKERKMIIEVIEK
jgi:pyrimidine-nucleoside phosphorylase